MGNIHYRDSPYVVRWEQIRKDLADRTGKPISMADLDYFLAYVGADPIQRSIVDNILSQPFEVATRGEAEVGISHEHKVVAARAEAGQTTPTSGSANERQVGGSHYHGRKVQHWDYAYQLPYLEGAATAYIDRHREKGGKEDLQKAIHFIEKMIEVYYPD